MFAREASKETGEDGKKKRGGVSVPEHWPWMEAKKVFEKPDVLPADEVDVSEMAFVYLPSLNGHPPSAPME